MRTKWLQGKWQLEDYYQIDPDGMSHRFKPLNGKLELSGGTAEKSGNIILNFQYEKMDSLYKVNVAGTYSSISKDSILIQLEGIEYPVYLQRQTKKDMHWVTKMGANPYDGMIWRRL
ncbi:MAG: hypothetical protein KJ941_10215 [Bacteroidetes bacterium]|nr:hypothetical protein [Bacteroidota bacterium]